MTSRQTGRRTASRAAPRNKKRVPQKTSRRCQDTTRKTTRRREGRQLIRLVVCGGIFALLVAVKLLLPEKMEQVNKKLSSAMEQNMDVQAVFSAVGRAFDGESGVGSVAEDVYQAVFHPGEEAVETAAHVAISEDLTSLDTLRGYRSARDRAEPQETQPQESSGGAAGEASTLAYVLYSEENLPENVSMEQAVLGFSYCTPVNGCISSEFGYRKHPVEGEERFHYGLDLAADTGTEICCFADGTITAVGESSSYGKYCMVAHEGGYSSLYAHCSRITATAGKTVKEGEKIAEVGETGFATGPHLHFELQKDGVYLNPIYYVEAS